MIIEQIGRTGSAPFLQLADSIGASCDLGKVRTGNKYRKETIDEIKTNLSIWMRNQDFEPIRGQQLDLAIFIKLSPYRLKKQDIDNVAKIICGALKERRGDDRFLFNDDSQIVRLLVWKIQREEYPFWKTDSYDISFRLHDSNKPTELVQPKVI
jgi:Holliday junction resolvase RusA-like endonuclease